MIIREIFNRITKWYRYGFFCLADWMMPRNTATKTEIPLAGWTSRYLTSRRKWTFSAEPWSPWRRTEAVTVKGLRTWRPRSTDSDWWVIQNSKKGGGGYRWSWLRPPVKMANIVKDQCFHAYVNPWLLWKVKGHPVKLWKSSKVIGYHIKRIWLRGKS